MQHLTVSLQILMMAKLSQADKDEYRHNTPYDGYAVLEGHISDAVGVGFYEKGA